jgi:NTE family protein
MNHFIKFGSIAIAFILLAGPAAKLHGEDEKTPPPSPRPKIGLVLSGGGAPGLVYVGVLQALEELRIPIDAIAGTSIGSVAGGLYASGLSPEEIEAFVHHADWNFMLSDAYPRESDSFRRKQRDFDLNQGLAFSVSSKPDLTLPVGLTTARNLMANLRELTIATRQIHDFDKLRIRFRAAATDLETGELVVLRKGDLIESMRASMAIPAVFTPQRIDGRSLVDGGLSANLPVQTMQEMGVDSIIAVDVGGRLKKEPEVNSALIMADQVISIYVKNQTLLQVARLGAKDVYLPLKIDDMGPADFPTAAKKMHDGYEQIMQRRADLVRFSVGPEEYKRYLARQRVAPVQGIQITYLKVQTPAGDTEHRLSQPIDFETKDPARFAKIQSAVADLGPLQKYEARDYEVIGEPGNYGLLVKTRPKKGGPMFLNMGFDYAYSSADESRFNLLLSLRMTELNKYGGEWVTFLSLGNDNRVISEWYQPVEMQRRFFFAPQAVFGSEFIDGRDANGDGIRFRQQDDLVGLDVGARLWQTGEFRFGYATGVTRYSRRFGLPSDVPGSNDRGFLHADLTLDTLDAATFAKRGYYGRVSVVAAREDLGASDNYTRIEGQFYKPITFGKNTIVPRVVASVNLGSDAVPLYDQVPLGGLFNLSGLARGSLFDENEALAELIYYRKLTDLSPAVGRSTYAGFSIEAGEVWGGSRSFHPGDFVLGGSIFVGADTHLGPVHLGLGLSEGGHAAVYLQLGPVFGQGRHQR